jgi:hypothetical protein
MRDDVIVNVPSPSAEPTVAATWADEETALVAAAAALVAAAAALVAAAAAAAAATASAAAVGAVGAVVFRCQRIHDLGISRHTGLGHTGNRHSGNRHSGNRHSGNRHSGNRHSGNRHTDHRHTAADTLQQTHCSRHTAADTLATDTLATDTLVTEFHHVGVTQHNFTMEANASCSRDTTRGSRFTNRWCSLSPEMGHDHRGWSGAWFDGGSWTTLLLVPGWLRITASRTSSRRSAEVSIMAMRSWRRRQFSWEWPEMRQCVQNYFFTLAYAGFQWKRCQIIGDGRQDDETQL